MGEKNHGLLEMRGSTENIHKEIKSFFLLHQLKQPGAFSSVRIS